MSDFIQREPNTLEAAPDLELTLLAVLDESEEPMGAVALDLELRSWINISQATIGRKLAELDRRGFTERIGYRGRQITSEGKKYLQQVLDSMAMESHGSALLRTLQADDAEVLIHVLEVRRALEQETTRLATIRMNESDFAVLERIVTEHHGILERGEYGIAEDRKFHETIAMFSKNPVLLDTLRLVRSRAQLSEVVDKIRKRVGSKLVREHRDIVDKMRTRDPNMAAEAMANHIDQIIKDVQTYFGIHGVTQGTPEPDQNQSGHFK